MKVIFSSPDWRVSGVNTFIGNLVSRLVEAGVDAKIALTNASSVSRNIPATETLPFLDLGLSKGDGPREGWRRLREYLLEHAPCVYVPGFDFFSNWQSATLPNEVRVISVIHSDEAIWFSVYKDVSPAHDAVVVVSDWLRRAAINRCPSNANKTRVIHYGVQSPIETVSPNAASNEPLKLLYAGRIIQYQKRILDLPKIVRELLRRGVDCQLTVVGDGPDVHRFEKAASELLHTGKVTRMDAVGQEEIYRMFESHDAFLLPSSFEGLPLMLLEGMSRGCVPIVSNIRSGIPEAVDDRVNGMLCRIGDISSFADAVQRLSDDRDLLLQMSQKSREKFDQQFTDQIMSEKWCELLSEVHRGQFEAPTRRASISVPARFDEPVTLWGKSVNFSIRLVYFYYSRLLRVFGAA